MLIAYAAHTKSCTFLLDAEGICRWVIAHAGAKQASLQVAQRCVGAQYVASLDATADGLLVQRPRRGATMLFARSKNGRISLLRTEALTRFEVQDDADEVRDDDETVKRRGRTEEDPPTIRRIHRSMLPRARASR
jgi:hypothetical protein